MTDENPIDPTIGGTHPVRTSRGFSVYGEIADDRGNVTRVLRSSAAGEPHCHVFVRGSDGRSVVTGVAGVPNGVMAVSPHLTRTQAREVAEALLRFANEVL